MHDVNKWATWCHIVDTQHEQIAHPVLFFLTRLHKIELECQTMNCCQQHFCNIAKQRFGGNWDCFETGVLDLKAGSCYLTLQS